MLSRREKEYEARVFRVHQDWRVRLKVTQDTNGTFAKMFRTDVDAGDDPEVQSTIEKFYVYNEKDFDKWVEWIRKFMSLVKEAVLGTANTTAEVVQIGAKATEDVAKAKKAFGNDNK